MNTTTKLLWKVCFIALAGHAGTTLADDRADYQKRVATRYLTLFQELDRDRDGRVTRAEAAGDLNFLPAFSDMDINGDGAVTADELHRFIDLKLDVRVQAGG